MDLLLIALLCVAVGLLYVWWSSSRLPPNYPPGPWGLPFVGYALFIGREPLHVFFARLGARYGGIYHIPFGVRNVVVLNDWASVKEALVDQSETFSGRPDNFLLDQTINREDIVSSDGPIWKEMRRFALHHMRNLGVGKTSMEDIILGEMEKIKSIVDAHGDRPVEMQNLFFMPILNIVWGFVAGKTYNYDDKTMLKLSKTIKELFSLFYKCLAMNGFPIARYLPGSSFWRLLEVNGQVKQFIEDEVDDHMKSYKEGTVRDFIDIYLSEIKATNKHDSQEGPFQKKYLIGTVYNFFNAGVETTQHIMLWSLMYVTTWPEIQEKVQEEIDRIIGQERFPAYSDRALLPYTEAVLMEAHRYASIVPGSVPHSNIKEAKVQGYTLPKQSFVIQNIMAIHNDPKLWFDPKVFRPERFIDDTGKVKKPEYLIPFSLGSRQCLGEMLAKVEHFLFFTCLLQRYHLRFPTGVKPPSLEPSAGLALSPEPFSIVYKRRR